MKKPRSSAPMVNQRLTTRADDIQAAIRRNEDRERIEALRWKVLMAKTGESARSVSWNYRVVHHRLQRAQLGDGQVVPAEIVDEYSIHEVYYNDAGGVTNMTVDAMPVYAETVDGVRWVLDKMREALDKDVLEYDVDKLTDDPQPENNHDVA